LEESHFLTHQFHGFGNFVDFQQLFLNIKASILSQFQLMRHIQNFFLQPQIFGFTVKKFLLELFDHLLGFDQDEALTFCISSTQGKRIPEIVILKLSSIRKILGANMLSV
jgi:hypothetical protein